MNPFLISEIRLAELTATRQGRISLSGFNFQAAYAVARLASMVIRRPILELPDFPIRLRYDWGEDLDEQCDEGRVVFTQCKRIATIGQPAGLASLLQSFAAKWLSVPTAQRDRVYFRLVCTDPRFQAGGQLSSVAADSRNESETHFTNTLGTKPGDRSDRARWQADADDVGHALLFASLWERSDVLFLTPEVITGLPAGPLLFAEREALEDLLTFSRIDPSKQSEALAQLRRIIHDNLITFDPTNEAELDYSGQTPRVRIRADVANALASCRTPAGSNLPFEVVDRTFLSKQREAPRRHFVARQPDWADVVHGADETVKFLERSVTTEIRTNIITELVEPIERGTDQRLHMLFVVGAPGSGKTTLVRRIACMLVEEGRVVVADGGIDVREPVGSPDDYASSLEKLANAGRPVVLLLDDPLYGDSPWIQVLRRLNRPGLRVSVLAPCPQILFDRHRGSLPFGVVKHQSIGPPTNEERAEMRKLYGRAADVVSSSEEFLVITMEAAAGIPFDDIMRRLWLTLNDGKAIVEDDALGWGTLAWTLRAFMVVCYFHRAGVTCPEPVLRTVLEAEAPSAMSDALARLRAQDGWMIFRLTELLRNWAHQGTQIATAHQRIAERAWQVRPMTWLAIGDRVGRASLAVPQAVRFVGQLAARLRSSETESDRLFADRLVDQWLLHDGISSIETRNLCDLTINLQANGEREVATRLAPLLRGRADELRDGWLAALQLCYLSGDSLATQTFPVELDLESTIQRADFSIAPNRATKFFARLPPNVKAAFKSRILASFDGQLDWKPASHLIVWLLGHGSPDEMLHRMKTVEAWLDDHPDDTHVRNGYLGLLSTQDFSEEKLRGVVTSTERWLHDHPDDSNVRTGYLGLLSNQRMSREQLARVMSNVEIWLTDHPDDTNTRNGYLGLLSNQRLTKEQLGRVMMNTEDWLTNHQDDTNTRNGYLGFLSNQKLTKEQLGRVMMNTETWLTNHQDDTHARNGYLGLLSSQKLTKEQLSRLMMNTEDWLTNHQDDTHTRNGYLGLLSKQSLSLEEFNRITASIEAWFDNHPQDTHVRNGFEAFVRSQSWFGAHPATTALADLWPRDETRPA